MSLIRCHGVVGSEAPTRTWMALPAAQARGRVPERLVGLLDSTADKRHRRGHAAGIPRPFLSAVPSGVVKLARTAARAKPAPPHCCREPRDPRARRRLPRLQEVVD